MTLQLSSKPLPKVIFFDAMGTLFDLKSSVGEIYQQFALKHGVATDANSLNAAFLASYQAAPSLAFSTTELNAIGRSPRFAIANQEFHWWKNVVKATFKQIDVLDKFSDFSQFFQELYFYFATKEPWYIYPDVLPCLQYWQQKQVQLAVISNFDSRLIEILQILDLSHFFTTITLSSLAGFAKPDQNIFKIALKKHNFIPQEAWHIGDSKTEDYQGANKSGIKAFWLNRDSYLLNIENELPNLGSLG
jgi:putative hydrolase of the HAD superfamily